jgi:hypothetical protein
MRFRFVFESFVIVIIMKYKNTKLKNQNEIQNFNFIIKSEKRERHDSENQNEIQNFNFIIKSEKRARHLWSWKSTFPSVIARAKALDLFLLFPCPLSPLFHDLSLLVFLCPSLYPLSAASFSIYGRYVVIGI